MYRTEQYINMTTMKDYIENYVDIEHFLGFCKECDNYNKAWSCPPYTFDPEDYWRRYKYIYVIGTKIIFNQKDIDLKMDRAEMKMFVEQILSKEKDVLSEKLLGIEGNYPGSVSLSAGSCSICKRCTKLDGLPCFVPDKMRYSIESLGGNVGKTVEKLLGFELNWMDDKLPEYFTLVNGYLTDHPDVKFI